MWVTYTQQLFFSTTKVRHDIYICIQGKNQVLGWDSIEDAISGKSPQTILGTGKGTKDSNAIKMANTIGWDGSHLWIGEFKFSTRVLGFKPVK